MHVKLGTSLSLYIAQTLQGQIHDKVPVTSFMPATGLLRESFW